GVPAVVCFLQHALVFQWRARADFSHGTLEDRAVVHQRMANLRAIQQPAGIRFSDLVAPEWMAFDIGQSICPGRGCSRGAGPGTVSHGRQYRSEILRPSGKFSQKGFFFAYRRYGMRARRRRELRHQPWDGSELPPETEFSRLHDL